MTKHRSNAKRQCDGERGGDDFVYDGRLKSCGDIEAAAYDLGLPYGTYRHRLRKAVALLTQELWDRSDGLGRRAAASDVAVFAGSCDPPGP